MHADMTKCPHMLRCMNRILTDDLLLEILCRLPCAESATRCKCVCKHWCNLISSPNFIARFIAHKLHDRSWISSKRVVGDPKHKSQKQLSQLASALWIQRYNKDQNDIVYPFNNLFTPLIGSEKSIFLDKAFCGDLVLSDNQSSEQPDLYICNPRTSEWFQLPSPPPPPCTIEVSRKGRSMPGFICDPYYYYHYNKIGNVSLALNTCYRYSVCFVFPESLGPATQLKMQLFSSETGCWRNAILLSPEKFKFHEAPHNGWFTYNRMLLLYCVDSLICFDPYKVTKDNVIVGHFIRMPPFALSRPQCLPSLCLGVFGERILIVQCSARLVRRGEALSIAEVDNNFKVWELKNYETGEWLLERTIFVRDLVSEDCTLDQHIKMQCPNTMVFNFHPYDPEIVLLGTLTSEPNQIVECNLRDRTMTTICNVDRWSITGIFTHNLWPTPVPKDL